MTPETTPGFPDSGALGIIDEIDPDILHSAKRAVLQQLPEGVILSYYEAESLAKAVLGVALSRGIRR